MCNEESSLIFEWRASCRFLIERDVVVVPENNFLDGAAVPSNNTSKVLSVVFRGRTICRLSEGSQLDSFF